MVPTFLARLTDPAIRNVLICGCGGGLDFVHGLVLVPELMRLGKTVVLGSYSFGDPEALTGDAAVVFEEPPVKRVTAATDHPPSYAPEVHVCSFLDEHLPEGRPHFAYAYHAREFTVPTLTRFYEQLAAEHDLDAVVLVDGGSDSLVVGDERGLGDPVEDAVSVESVAALSEVPLRILISAGLGVDRHNGVSNAASLRAVAELTEQGGFLGALALEREHEGYAFYRDAVRHIVERQRSGSVVAGAILAAVEGRFGAGDPRPLPHGRPVPDSLFVWPPMGILWAFDVEAVAARSKVCAWIRGAETPRAGREAVRDGRRAIRIRSAEEERLPDPEPSPYASLYDPEERTAP